MTLTIAWWIAAGLAAVAELFTGTFVLLMIAIGLGLAGTVAGLGMPLAGQLVAAALGSALAWFVLRRWRRRADEARDPQSDPGLNLDIGRTVQVETWQPDGTTQVHYRGSVWQARLADGAAARPGTYRIHAIEGSRLVLAAA